MQSDYFIDPKIPHYVFVVKKISKSTWSNTTRIESHVYGHPKILNIHDFSRVVFVSKKQADNWLYSDLAKQISDPQKLSSQAPKKEGVFFSYLENGVQVFANSQTIAGERKVLKFIKEQAEESKAKGLPISLEIKIIHSKEKL